MQKAEHKQLHFFYGGGVADEKMNCYASACHIDTAKIITKNGHLYTMYAVNYNVNTHKQIIDLVTALDGFEFCKPVQFRQMQKEMENCDYGIIPFSQCKLNKAMKSGNDGVNCTTKYIYGAANKCFDYIECGLPIVAKMHDEFLKIFKHYGMVYVSTIESLEADLPILIDKLPIYRNNIEKHINKLTMDSNIGRLIQFYYEINNEIK